MSTHQSQDAVAPDYTHYPATTQETIAQEKRPFLHEAESPESWLSPRRPQPYSRMVSSVRGLLIALACLLVFLSLTLALTDDPLPGCHDACDQNSAQSISDDSSNEDASALRNLLDAVSPESLHEFLHQYFPGRYQHGVWPSDRAALEAVAVHPEDGPAVTSLVRMLRRDNTTTTIPSSSEQSLPPASTTLVPTTTAITTSNQGPQTSSSIPTAGNAPSSPSSPTATKSNTLSKPAEAPTTSRRPQVNTFTSIVNGSPTVVTQTTFVEGIGGAEQSTIEASLQTNAAVAPGRGCQGLVDAAVAGAVVVGGVLFV